jgi:hypothetical protein
MNNPDLLNVSPRNFIAVAGSAVAALALAPRCLLADSKGIVPTMMAEASKATITTDPLRRNISVLEGSGGNIAVLTGNDGKLLVDSGFSVSKPRLLDALNRSSSDPSRNCSILVGTRIIPMAMPGYTMQELKSQGIKIPRSTYPPRLELKDGNGHSLLRLQMLSPVLCSTMSTACNITTRISQ